MHFWYQVACSSLFLIVERCLDLFTGKEHVELPNSMKRVPNHKSAVIPIPPFPLFTRTWNNNNKNEVTFAKH